MISTQTLPAHSSFCNKQKPLLITEQIEHDFLAAQSLGEHDNLNKSISQLTTSQAMTPNMLLRTHENSEKEFYEDTITPSAKETKKPNASPRASSENVTLLKNGLFSNKFANKWDKASEEASSEKDAHASEPASSRKASNDDTTYNVRKHSKPVGYWTENEERKGQNGLKKNVTDPTMAQQNNGYQLRNTGHRSSNKDTDFSDSYDNEHCERYPSSTDGLGGMYSNIRNKTQKGHNATSRSSMSAFDQEKGASHGDIHKKGGNLESTRVPSISNMTCQDDSCGFETTGENMEKERLIGSFGKAASQTEENGLNCAEQIENLDENWKEENHSESAESSTMSQSLSRGNGNRKNERKCLNKLCLTDPRIPSKWAKEKVKGSMICKMCFEAFLNEQYCYFCEQIYLEDESLTLNDEKVWICCDSCGCWNHIQCEAENGLKNASALQNDKTAKYFCPACRQNKTNKKTRNTGASDGLALTLRASVSPKQSVVNTPKKSSRSGRNEHSRPPLDDWLAYEEGLEEPPLTKVKVMGAQRETNFEEVAASGEDRTEEEDPIKKKLDSLLNRSNHRRRILQAKPTSNYVERFVEVEKLLVHFGGKKIHLNENEIKSDLDLMRDLIKATKSEAGMEVVEPMEEDISEDLHVSTKSISEKKVGARGKNNRGENNRKLTAKGKERNKAHAVHNVTKEERNIMGDEKDKPNFVTRMQLRNRKNNCVSNQLKMQIEVSNTREMDKNNLKSFRI